MLFNRKYELNVLINLAALDHIIEEKESRLIHLIGRANQIPITEIDEMIKRPEPIQGFNAMTPEEKFEQLFYLIRMMKADGQVVTDEIDFCESIAHRLGYKKGVVRELSAHIFSDLSVTTDMEFLRQKAAQYMRA